MSYFRDLVEAAGIPTMLRNEDLVHGIVEIPITEFYPNLCVMNDEDYEDAWKMIKDVLETEKRDPGADLVCPKCSEKNPGNFLECFSCQTPFLETESC